MTIYSRDPLKIGEVLAEQGRARVSAASLLDLPAEHARANFRDFSAAEYEDADGSKGFPVEDRLASWYYDGGCLLWIVGPQGAGKSRAACALALHAASQGLSVTYLVTSQLIAAHRGYGDQQVQAAAVHADLLVLDDYARTPLNPRDLTVVTDLLTARRGRTVFTSNFWTLADDDLAGEPDEALPLWSRLRTATVLPVLGPDRRTAPESSI